MSNVRTPNSPGTRDTQSKAALERSVKNMKMIIAALSVGLVACIIYIVASPTQSTQPQNMMSGVPAATQQTAPSAMPQETGTAVNTPAPAQQNPATATPAPTPAPVTTTTSTAPAGASSGKINPPHGQPGHRCDIAVGSALP